MGIEVSDRRSQHPATEHNKSVSPRPEEPHWLILRRIEPGDDTALTDDVGFESSPVLKVRRSFDPIMHSVGSIETQLDGGADGRDRVWSAGCQCWIESG